MSRTAQVLIILYFTVAGLFGGLACIYAHSWRESIAGLTIQLTALYALYVICRYEKTL